jgi:uncharacterized membrane protein
VSLSEHSAARTLMARSLVHTEQVLERRPAAPTALAVLLIVGGLLGLLAAFELTVDKIALLTNPSFVPPCNISPFLTCSTNLKSPLGSAFGFPNPLLGLMMFPAPIIVGVASLAGVAFPRWFWAAFNVGMAFAIGFVIWLMSVSVFVLGTLCPWCMVVWAVVIPMAISTTLFNLRNQALPLGSSVARFAGAALTWTPIITLLAYVTFAAIAQVRLDVLHRI